MKTNYDLHHGLVPISFAAKIPFVPVTRLLVPDAFKRTELAWKLSTTGDNPVLRIPRPGEVEEGALPPTGFEPYFLGLGLTPRQTIATIAETGARQLDLLAWRHSDDPYYIAHLLSLLEKGQIAEQEPRRSRDIQGLAEMDAILGSLTRWMGYQAQSNDEARHYREETHEFIEPFVGSLTYAEPAPDRLIETYELPDVSRAQQPIAAEWKDLRTYRARRGWRFMRLLGDRLGNAPVRSGLQDRWQRLPIQWRY